MRIISIFSMLVIFGCSSNHCDFVIENEDKLNKLISIIRQNPDEFSNHKLMPKTYYTYNYRKGFSEFEQIESSKNIDNEDYNDLKEIFSVLSIEKILIFDNKNLLFEIKNIDLYLSNFTTYIGYLEGKDIKEINKDVKIINCKNCKENWFYIVERTSVAN